MTKSVKRTALAAMGLIAVTLLVWAYFQQTTTHLTVDLNPAVEIEINRLNRVNRIAPANDDAQKLLDGYRGAGKPMDTVIGELVDRLILQGWLSNRDDHMILLTTHEVSDPNTLHRIEQSLEKSIADRNLRTGIRRASENAASTLGEDAEDLGVSAGKLELIRQVTKKNPALTEQELKQQPVQGLVGLLDKDDTDDRAGSDTPKTEKPATEAPHTESDTEAPKTEPPQTEKPRTEAPQTKSPRTEPPRTEPPRTEAPRTEPPRTEPAQPVYTHWDDDDDWDDDWDDDDWDDDWDDDDDDD